MGASGGVFAFPPGVWLGFQGLCARCPVAKWALSAALGLASTTYQAAALAWRIEPAATLFLFLGPLCQELCEASRRSYHEYQQSANGCCSDHTALCPISEWALVCSQREVLGGTVW